MFIDHIDDPLDDYQSDHSGYRSQHEYITGFAATLLHGLKSIPISNHAKLRSGYGHLLPELKRLYNILFNDQEEVILFQKILPFQEIKDTPSFCNKEIKKTQISYRCFDCMHHEASMICQDCFHSADHKNHRYRQINQEGCCDCGNQSILKSQSFCRQHRQKQNNKIEIPTSKQIVFKLYITQLFIWSLKIWSTINTSLGLRFLYNFLKYLSKLNKSSPYYNELTAELLFDHKRTIMEQIIHITLTATYLKEETNNVVFELMMELTHSQSFKEKLLKVFIGMYNKVEHFETSKFMKFMPILLTDGVAIKKVMKDAVQSLNPTARSYQTMTYYQHLMMLRYLQPQAIEIFFAPLLKKGIIASPMLQLIQKRCQVGNSREMYLSTISQNTQQQFVYYRLLSMIIGATNDRNILEDVIINYSRKIDIDQYTFKINKIVLIPQRVLTWAIYKYFDCQLTHLNFDVLQKMLSMQKGRVVKLLTNMLYTVLDCLGQYALDLVRNTYFYSYRSMYIKDESQTVMIDYLAIKVLAQLFESNECGSFSKILQEYIQNNFSADSEEIVLYQRSKDKFDRLNKMVEILIEIIYSPKVEVVNCIMLSNTTKVRRQIGNLLARIVKTRGKINQNQYSSIIKHFFFNQSIEEIVMQVLSFNKQTKKYEVIYPNEVGQMRLDLMVSLTHTDLQTFLINENNPKLQLSSQQQQLRDLIFSPEIIQSILSSQFQFVQGGKIDNFAANIIELTKITYKINLLFQFQSQSCKQYLLIYRQLIDYQIGEISKSQNHPLAAIINKLPTEYQKIVNNSARQVKEDVQLKRRKELAKAKKQKMIRQRKMVQNSQLHLIKHEQTLSPHKNHQLLECLICRQKSQSNKLCYFAKVKYNNIIANTLGDNSKHLMFYTCFHTVHLECYLKQTSFNPSMNCPLCKLCCNIVLAHEDGSVQKLQLVRLLKNRIRQSVSYYYMNSVFTEIIVFMVYLILINIENEHLSQRQLRLCSSLYQLLELDTQQAPQQVASLINQVTKPKVNRVIKVMYELFKQSTSAHNIQKNEFNVHDYAQQTFEKLSQLIGQFAASRLVKSMLEIIDKSVQNIFDWEIQPQPVQKLIKFTELPRDIKGLFELRDKQKCKTNINHGKVICYICGAKVCPQCKQTKQHSEKYHNKEALYFKTNTGGFLYDTSSRQLQVRSFYINELGTIWKPELQSKEFKFDDELFQKILTSIKYGNLFYFLTNNMQGLKGSNINDII